MKRMTAVLLSLVMTMGLAACAGNEQTSENAPAGQESSSAEETNAADETAQTEDTADDNETGDNKVLVAFFSATGTTKGVAEQMADGLGADLYEIVPAEPYTDADLDYNDDNSRSTIEMNDPSARPEISGSVEDMEQYEIVFLGYPIWLAYHNLIQCTQA